MSSIFSDPFFRRGSTLLAGETIDLDAAGSPVAGGEVVGQVKVFQDVQPTGRGDRYSNRLVYCVAARYKGSNTTGSALAGTVVKFDTGNMLTEFTGAASNGDVAVGVVDEYLTGEVRTNDIVWIVVKGPVAAASTTAAVNAGAKVEIGTSGDAGKIKTNASGTVIGFQIVGSNVSSVSSIRINLNSSMI